MKSLHDPTAMPLESLALTSSGHLFALANNIYDSTFYDTRDSLTLEYADIMLKGLKEHIDSQRCQSKTDVGRSIKLILNYLGESL